MSRPACSDVPYRCVAVTPSETCVAAISQLLHQRVHERVELVETEPGVGHAIARFGHPYRNDALLRNDEQVLPEISARREAIGMDRIAPDREVRGRERSEHRAVLRQLELGDGVAPFGRADRPAE